MAGKSFPYFPTRVPANCIRAPNSERCIYIYIFVYTRGKPVRASLSPSPFLPAREANATLTNQLAVNHPRARNNLHTRAQSTHTNAREEGAATVSFLVSSRFLSSARSLSLSLLLLLLSLVRLNSRLRNPTRRDETIREEGGRRARAAEDNGIA